MRGRVHARGERLGAVLLAVLAVTLAGAAGASAQEARHSLRSPVTDENFYFVMADRFENGSTANDLGGLPPARDVSGYDPTARGYYHGGDLRGIIRRLDYIRGLGTTSIWLTPSFKNRAVQPAPDSLGRLPRLLDHGLHADRPAPRDERRPRGARRAGARPRHEGLLRHHHQPHGRRHRAATACRARPTSRRTRSPTGPPPASRSTTATTPAPDTFPELDPATSFPYTPILPAGGVRKVPEWLNDTTLYHNRGDTTFTGEDSLYGDFFGLDDLFTEHPRVVDGMIDIYKGWIRDFGIDGFRIDTMKHVNDEFWQKFGPEVLDYAREQGKAEFFMFGEVFDTTKCVHVALHDPQPDAVDPRLPVPGRRAGLRRQLGAVATARGLLRRRRLVHRRGLERLPAADLPRQPRHGPHRALRAGGQPRRDGRRAARPRPPRARAHVPLARQPGHLLRRRAGLHGRRRRPARAPGHVPEPRRRVQRRRPDRHRRDDRRVELRSRAPALPRRRPPGPADARAPGAARRRSPAPLRDATAPASTPSRASAHAEQREYVVALNNAETEQTRVDPDLRARPALHARLRPGPGRRPGERRRPPAAHRAAAVGRRLRVLRPDPGERGGAVGLPRRAGGERRGAQPHAGRRRGGRRLVRRGHLRGQGGRRRMDLRSAPTTTRPTASSTTSPARTRAPRSPTAPSCSTTAGTPARAACARPRCRRRGSRSSARRTARACATRSGCRRSSIPSGRRSR